MNQIPKEGFVCHVTEETGKNGEAAFKLRDTQREKAIAFKTYQDKELGLMVYEITYANGDKEKFLA